MYFKSCFDVKIKLKYLKGVFSEFDLMDKNSTFGLVCEELHRCKKGLSNVGHPSASQTFLSLCHPEKNST